MGPQCVAAASDLNRSEYLQLFACLCSVIVTFLLTVNAPWPLFFFFSDDNQLPLPGRGGTLDFFFNHRCDRGDVLLSYNFLASIYPVWIIKYAFLWYNTWQCIFQTLCLTCITGTTLMRGSVNPPCLSDQCAVPLKVTFSSFPLMPFRNTTCAV